MEGHGPADPPITIELRRAAAAAQVSRPVVKDLGEELKQACIRNPQHTCSS
uniref:Uncharacterized protein n=1 Tax=Anguilla anguilla TaxID=7936 RepID=A0A0E9TU08_ANGAN